MTMYSLAVDGSGQNATFPFPAFASTDDWGLSFWVKMLNTSGSFIAMMDDSGVVYRMMFASTGVNSGFSGTMMPSAGDLPNDDNWHHLVVTRIGGVTGFLHFYVDGSEVFFTANTAAPAGVTVHFGDNASGGGSHFFGKYADIRVYTAYLLSGDVTALYAGSDFTTGIVRHWPMTDGSGTTVTDTSGSGVNGSASGGATWDADLPAALSGGGGGGAQDTPELYRRHQIHQLMAQ